MSAHPEAVPSQAKVLRRLYLALFLRGRSARGLNVNRTVKSIGRRLLGTMAMYAAVGCFALYYLGKSLFSLSIYQHSSTLFFVGMFVASSAGEVLFNKEEGEILLHRPIEPRALLWAKISVLVQVSLWLSLAFNLAGMIAGSAMAAGNAGYFLAHAVSTTILAFLCSGSVVLVYQLCLKWFGRERLDGLMTTTQVLMTILLVVGGQVAPHLTRLFPGEIHLGRDNWWLSLLPSAWFAAMDETLLGRGNGALWGLAALGLLVTAGIMALAFGKLAASYQTGLQSLGEAQAARPAKAGRPRKLERLVSLPPLSWSLRHPVQRAGFLLTAAYMFRDRETKLRLYPGLAPMLIMPVVLLVGGGRGHHDSTNEFLLTLVGGYVALIPMLALNLLQYSQNWQAADVFRITPLTGPGPLLTGARKAVNAFVVFPALLIAMAAVLLVGGKFSSLILLLPGALSLPFFSRTLSLNASHLPFATPVDDIKAARRGLGVFISMMSAMAIGGAGAAARTYGYFYPFLAVELVLVAIGCWLMDRATSRLRWPEIESAEPVRGPAGY